MSKIDKAIESFQTGISINSLQIFAEILPRARFREEVNLDLNARDHHEKAHLMFVKLFKGRPPHYKPWIELFDIQPHIKMREKTIPYFDSPLEIGILTFFSESLLPGQNLFIEYYRDTETMYQLQRDIPFPATRLGFKLVDLGFYWSKDWYFPEGFMEGEQKLQVEKPLNRESEQRQKRLISKSLNRFLSNRHSNPSQNVFIKMAQERAIIVIKNLEAE